MSKRQCFVCGKDPAEGYASIYRDGKEQWYCHPDEGESCYVSASNSNLLRVQSEISGQPGGPISNRLIVPGSLASGLCGVR